MKFLVVDIETTGFPSRPAGRGGMYSYHSLDKYDSSRIVSIAWVLLDSNYDTITEDYYIVKPNGFKIPERATEIHGITTEMAMSDGIVFDKVVEHLDELFKKYPDITHIVAHNLDFDLNIIKSELYRHDALSLLSEFKKLREICTMKETARYMINGKFPKLSELYALCFEGKDMDNAHNALHDTRNCAACFAFIARGELIDMKRYQ